MDGRLRSTQSSARCEFQMSMSGSLLVSPMIKSLEKSARVSQGTTSPLSRIVQEETRPPHFGTSFSGLFANCDKSNAEIFITPRYLS